jgi:hypothetical protein
MIREEFIYKLVLHKPQDIESPYINVTGAAAYIHFSNGNIVDIIDINAHSSYISELKNRPIFVLNYNPHTMSVSLGTTNFTVTSGK